MGRASQHKNRPREAFGSMMGMCRNSFFVCAALATVVRAGCPIASIIGNRVEPLLAKPTEAFYHTRPQLDDAQSRYLEETMGFPDSTMSKCLAKPPSCAQDSKYYTYDGACNNLKNPLWGSRHQCHSRLLPAAFQDGVSEPPKDRVDIAKLYNALQSRPVATTSNNGFISQFANAVFQLLVHDMTTTSISEFTGKNQDCCGQSCLTTPQCSMSVDLRQISDYSKEGAKCMSFVRAARCPCSSQTPLRPKNHRNQRESENQETAYIDLSSLYTPNRQLDPERPWRLASRKSPASGEVPVAASTPSKTCYSKECFQVNVRTNQQQMISSQYVLWRKLHNIIADRLKELNPHWTDDRVFEEARKINIARWQFVNSNENHNIVFDEKVLIDHKIDIEHLKNGTEYDPSIPATTFAESVHSEFRGHGFVANTIGPRHFIWLDSTNYLNNSFNYFMETIRDMWSTGANFRFPYTAALSHELLIHPDDKLGQSMLLINIQRNRDVGLPSYRALLEWAYKKKVKSFDDLAALDNYDQKNVNFLKSIFRNIDQIDMFVGGQLAGPYGTGITPYSHQLIRATQFRGQVYGDRLFFSHKGVFTEDQLKFIHQTNFTKVLCQTGMFDQVSASPMLYSDNPEMVNCGGIKEMDLSAWAETAPANN